MGYRISKCHSWAEASILCIGLYTSGHAAPISFQVDVKVTTAYDYAASQYVSIAPLSGILNFSFDDAGEPRVCISQSSCPIQTIFPSGISASSSLSALIPPNFPSGTGSPSVYYAPDFATSGYNGVFDWASGGATIFEANSGEYLTQVIYATILKLGSYNVTFDSAESFLMDALNNPDSFRVIAGVAWYSSPIATPTTGDFTQGFDWRDWNAFLSNVNGVSANNPPVNVSEPSSVALLGLGMLGILVIHLYRRRSAFNKPAPPPSVALMAC